MLVQYGGSAATWVAATVVAALHVRTNMVGLLNLHTVPSREIFTIIRTMQASGQPPALPPSLPGPVPGRNSRC